MLKGETSNLTKKSLGEYLKSESSNLIVADEGGTVVGLLSFHIVLGLSDAKPVAMIDDLIVRKPYRNKGIGTSLMKYALKKLKQSNCEETAVVVNMKNIYAQRFYKLSGFKYEANFLLTKQIND